MKPVGGDEWHGEPGNEPECAAREPTPARAGKASQSRTFSPVSGVKDRHGDVSGQAQRIGRGVTRSSSTIRIVATSRA